MGDLKLMQTKSFLWDPVRGGWALTGDETVDETSYAFGMTSCEDGNHQVTFYINARDRNTHDDDSESTEDLSSSHDIVFRHCVMNVNWDKSSKTWHLVRSDDRQ